MCTVDVVVLTRNRSSDLSRCVRALEAQTRLPEKIIVVDASDDGPFGVNGELLKALSVEVDHVRCGVAVDGAQPMMRNVGVSRSLGDFIFFTDDDGLPQTDWIDVALPLYRDEQVGAVGGRVVQGSSVCMSGSDDPLLYSCVRGSRGNVNVVAGDAVEVQHLQGTNMSVRRSALEIIAGFDERLCGGYASFEETDVCLRLRVMGYKVMFVPAAVVVHGVSPRVNGLPRDVSESAQFLFSYCRNLQIVNRNYVGAFRAALFLFPSLIFVLGRVMVALLRREGLPGAACTLPKLVYYALFGSAVGVVSGIWLRRVGG